MAPRGCRLGKPKILRMTLFFDRAAPVASAVPGAAPAPKLLDRMRDHLHARHYSIRTETAYVDWARRFILFHGKRHPLEMGAAEVEAFLTYWSVQRQVSASIQNQAKAAFCVGKKGIGRGFTLAGRCGTGKNA